MKKKPLTNVLGLSEISFTEHASYRMAQRNLSREAVQFVIEHGRRHHRAGACFFFLGKRDIPADSRQELARLEGAVVVLNLNSRSVLTVYRNREGLRDIKRKTTYALTEEQMSWSGLAA